MTEPHFVLASASPRRNILLELTGWEKQVFPVEVDEKSIDKERPEEMVRRLARQKARRAAEELNGLILAADTVVVDGDQILGKPADANEAEEMLTSLKGRSHLVMTAITLIMSEPEKVVDDLCLTHVPMRLYSDQEIEIYISTASPLDKAGAYGIQDDHFHPVNREEMTGCFANVMGLPLCHLVRSMSKVGFSPSEDVPAACMKFTKYDCKVYHHILTGRA